jgi:hypothetical protein
MTQRTRNIISNAFLALSVVSIVVFVAQHFMSRPRPSWHRDLSWLALAFVSASAFARGRRRRRRSMQY